MPGITVVAAGQLLHGLGQPLPLYRGLRWYRRHALRHTSGSLLSIEFPRYRSLSRAIESYETIVHASSACDSIACDLESGFGTQRASMKNRQHEPSTKKPL